MNSPSPIIDKHTPLFSIWLSPEWFPHRGRLWRNVCVSLFRENESPWTYKYEDLILGYTGENHHGTPEVAYANYSEDAIQCDFFLESEKDAILEYFKRNSGYGPVGFKQEPAPQISNCHMSVSATVVGGDCDFYMFSKVSDFDCPISFWGYYLVDYEEGESRLDDTLSYEEPFIYN